MACHVWGALTFSPSTEKRNRSDLEYLKVTKYSMQFLVGKTENKDQFTCHIG